MTVEFALFLSPEGIALAQRQQAGHWALVAEARPEGDDLGPAMAELRSVAEARGGSDAQVLLVLPDDQILYTSFMAPAHDADLVATRITEGLDGLTPYAVEDLVHDWCAVEEDRVKVAVVARETLDEARDFALSHGFKSAGFAAMPPAERFPAMPVFGEDAAALGLDRGGMSFGSDDWTPPEPEVAPETDAKPEASDDAEAEADAAPGTTETGEKVAGGDTAEAGLPEGDAPEAEAEAEAEAPSKDDAATKDAEAVSAAPSDPAAAPAEAAAKTAREAEENPRDPPAQDKAEDRAGDEAEAAPQPTMEEPVPTDPEGDAGAEAKGDDGSRDEAPEEAGPNPILDPTLEQPVLPIMAEPDLPLSGVEAEADPQPGAKAKPDAAKIEEPDAETPDQADAADKPADKPARGKGAVRAQPRLNAERPEGAQARPTGARRLSIPSEAGSAETPEIEDRTGPEEGPDPAAAGGPVPAFTARRGKVAKPETGAGDSLSSRPSRLGFGGASPAPTPPVLHPDATVGPATPAPVRPGHRLAAQLARVRDASKLAMPLGGGARAQDTGRAKAEERAPRVAAEVDTPLPEARDNMGGQAARAPETEEKTGRGLRLGLPRRKPDAAATQIPQAQARAQAQVDGGAAFASGLLARKPVESAGPSFKTGLILTLVLLVLLALIAIWSALFLPDSPIARLLGSGDRETAALEDPLPAPPLAVTAPPAMGALDTGRAEDETMAETAPVAQAELSPEAEAPAEELAALSEEPEAAPEAEAEAAAPVAALPDIDADLDLPPLPPLPEERLPTLEETERIYAEDGIWPRTPDRPTLAALSTSNEIYVASIDPEVPVTDAIALADPVLDPGEILRRVPPPPPFGVTPDRDARGLVTPTPEGVLTPEGAFVISGRPVVDAIPRPREVVPDPAPALPEIDLDDAILRTVQPTPRPLDLEETRERQVLGGFSASELAALRPEERPVSAQESAAQASLFPREAEAAVTEAVAAAIEGSELAIESSRPPRLRPENIAALVAAAQESAPAVPQEAIARAPDIPSNADVTRAATERNAIRLRDINLIGVTGTPSDRRALVRLPSGRFVRVGVGDRLDGGRVAAIGENSLQYVRNGRNVTLEIPG